MSLFIPGEEFLDKEFWLFGESKAISVGDEKYTLLPILLNKHDNVINRDIYENDIIRLCTAERAIPLIAPFYVEYYNSAEIGEEWTIETAVKYLNWFNDSEDCIFLTKWAIDAGGNLLPVGFFCAHIKPYDKGNSLWDPDLFVIPKFQKQGIGKELINAIIKKIDKLNYKVISFYGLTYSDDTGHPLNMWENIGIKKTRMVHISGDIDDMKEAANK